MLNEVEVAEGTCEQSLALVACESHLLLVCVGRRCHKSFSLADERVSVSNHNVVVRPVASYTLVGRINLAVREIAKVVTVADKTIETVELDICEIDECTRGYRAQIGVKRIAELAQVLSVLDGSLLVKSANRLQIHIAGRESHGSQQHH